MTTIELIELLKRTKDFVVDNSDCADRTCECEGNDYPKDLKIKLAIAIDVLSKEGLQ